MECMVPTAIKARAIAPSLTPVARTDVEIGALPLDPVVAMALERVVDEEIAVTSVKACLVVNQLRAITRSP